MSLQLDMCRVEIDIEKAKREWALESAQSNLKDDPENVDLQNVARAAQANVDLWNDYISLLYPS